MTNMLNSGSAAAIESNQNINSSDDLDADDEVKNGQLLVSAVSNALLQC